MKRKILLSFLILLVGVAMVGCNEKKKEKETPKSWEIMIDSNKQVLDNDLIKVFDNAKKTHKGDIDYVALLAKQVVAGTNYMFLCREDNSYKIAVVYKDLEGKSEITNVVDFNPVAYVNQNNDSIYEQLAGGWYVEIPEEKGSIDSTINNFFEKATETLTGAAYYPIAVLAKQSSSKTTSYAILCYGEGTYRGTIPGIYMLTLNIDDKNNSNIASISAIDLPDFNI